MKMIQIVNAIGALRKISDASIPVKYTYALYIMLNKIYKDYEFYTNKRNELLTKYGNIQPDGHVDIPTENKDALNVELQELLNIDVEDVRTIKLPLLDGIKLSYNDMMLLNGFVEFVTDGDT